MEHIDFVYLSCKVNTKCDPLVDVLVQFYKAEEAVAALLNKDQHRHQWQ